MTRISQNGIFWSVSLFTHKLIPDCCVFSAGTTIFNRKTAENFTLLTDKPQAGRNKKTPFILEKGAFDHKKLTIYVRV